MSPADSTKKAASSLQEVEETVARLTAHKGVKKVVILSKESGDVVFGTPDDVDQAKTLTQVTSLSQSLFDSSDVLSFVRIRSQKHEVMVAPHSEYVLVVWHDPQAPTPEL